MAGKEQLDGDEKQPRKDDVQDKPIEPEENRTGAGRSGNGLDNAKGGRKHDEEEGRKAEDLILTQDEADERHDEGGDEPELKAEMEKRLDVEFADFRDGEPAREMEADDDQETGERQDERGHAADPPLAELTFGLGRLQVRAEHLAKSGNDRHGGKFEQAEHRSASYSRGTIVPAYLARACS